MINLDLFCDVDFQVEANDMADASDTDDAALDWEKTGERIAWLRMFIQKWDQGELARRVSRPQSYISAVEKGKKKPSYKLLVLTADALNTTTDYLLLRTDNPSPIEDSKPTFYSEEAEIAARIIDELPERYRAECLRQVQTVRAHAERDETIRAMLESIERDYGPEARARIIRAFGPEAT